MTDEQLKQGQDLKSRIDSLKNKIGYWEKAEYMTEIHLQYTTAYPSERRSVADDGRYINFGVLKTLTLQTMKTKLEELEKEYREL